MKIWAFCVFMPQKLQDMSSFLGFGGNSALLQENEELNKQVAELQKTCEEERGKALAALTKRDELDAKVTKLLDKMGD